MNSEHDSGETCRLFFAAMLSPELVESIKRIQSRASIDLPRGIRWVKPNQAHLTLAFLGDVAAAHIQELDCILTNFVQNRSALSFHVEGIGGFPRAERPRVMWAGLTGEQIPELINLHEELWLQIAHIKEPSEFSQVKYRPHITLARVPGAQPPRLADWMARHSDWNFGVLHFSNIVLMRSVLTNQGPIYETIFSKPLGHT